MKNSLAVLVASAGLLLSPVIGAQAPQQQQKVQPRSEVPADVRFARPIPQSGIRKIYWTDAPFLATIRIDTAGPGHHFVRFADWATGKPVHDHFVLERQADHTALPLGTYRVKFASGSDWFGDDLLFGRETRYAQWETKLELLAIGRVVNVNLYPMQPGRIQPIKPADF